MSDLDIAEAHESARLIPENSDDHTVNPERDLAFGTMPAARRALAAPTAGQAADSSHAVTISGNTQSPTEAQKLNPGVTRVPTRGKSFRRVDPPGACYCGRCRCLCNRKWWLPFLIGIALATVIWVVVYFLMKSLSFWKLAKPFIIIGVFAWLLLLGLLFGKKANVWVLVLFVSIEFSVFGSLPFAYNYHEYTAIASGGKELTNIDSTAAPPDDFGWGTFPAGVRPRLEHIEGIFYGMSLIPTCVAPVMASEHQNKASYWAVATGRCCLSRTAPCDDWLNPSIRSAILQPSDDLFPGAYIAVKQAATESNIDISNGFVLVRWTPEPEAKLRSLYLGFLLPISIIPAVTLGLILSLSLTNAFRCFCQFKKKMPPRPTRQPSKGQPSNGGDGSNKKSANKDPKAVVTGLVMGGVKKLLDNEENVENAIESKLEGALSSTKIGGNATVNKAMKAGVKLAVKQVKKALKEKGDGDEKENEEATEAADQDQAEQADADGGAEAAGDAGDASGDVANVEAAEAPVDDGFGEAMNVDAEFDGGFDGFDGGFDGFDADWGDVGDLGGLGDFSAGDIASGLGSLGD